MKKILFWANFLVLTHINPYPVKAALDIVPSDDYFYWQTENPDSSLIVPIYHDYDPSQKEKKSTLEMQEGKEEKAKEITEKKEIIKEILNEWQIPEKSPKKSSTSIIGKSFSKVTNIVTDSINMNIVKPLIPLASNAGPITRNLFAEGVSVAQGIKENVVKEFIEVTIKVVPPSLHALGNGRKKINELTHIIKDQASSSRIPNSDQIRIAISALLHSQ